MVSSKGMMLIVLVDDDPSDCELIRRSLTGTSRPIEFVSLGSGPEALDYLRREGQWSDADSSRIPDLLILDLEMPGMRGQEVLARIRSDPSIPYFPVVVLTSSDDPKDVAGCYQDGANSYVVKPFGVDPFIETIDLIERFWLDAAYLRRPGVEA